MSSKRQLTQDDVRNQGECGHGFNYGGPGGTPRYCGKSSEPGATFGDCPEHAGQFRAMAREIEQQGRRLESAEGIERGHRALGGERWENLPDTSRDEITKRVFRAQERARHRPEPRSRGRSR